MVNGRVRTENIRRGLDMGDRGGKARCCEVAPMRRVSQINFT